VKIYNHLGIRVQSAPMLEQCQHSSRVVTMPMRENDSTKLSNLIVLLQCSNVSYDRLGIWAGVEECDVFLAINLGLNQSRKSMCT
jgi:hypothetical protein